MSRPRHRPTRDATAPYSNSKYMKPPIPVSPPQPQAVANVSPTSSRAASNEQMFAAHDSRESKIPLVARPHPYDSLVAYVDLPIGLDLRDGSEVFDSAERKYKVVARTEFEWLANHTPVSHRACVQVGRCLFVLPADVSQLMLKL